MAVQREEKKKSVDFAAQQAILVETMLKEERYQKLFTNYSINPFKKSEGFLFRSLPCSLDYIALHYIRTIHSGLNKDNCKDHCGD